MSTPLRVAGHRGKRPAKRLPLRFASEYAREPFPSPSYPVDVTSGITDWRMLGNGPDPTCTVRPDGCGDCTFAGREHYKMAKAAAAGETEQWESSNALVEEYLAYDHGQDEGAVIADLLMSWYDAGKILAFAPVDHTDKAEMDAAMQAFNGLYVGVSLTSDADELFQEGLPWTLANGEQPDPSEGHCIVKVKASGQGLDGYVTWGAEQPATEGWSAACLDEAWVIITSDDAPVDLPKLRADIDALHGEGGSGQPPAPAPHPSALHEVAADLRALITKAEQLLEAIGL